MDPVTAFLLIVAGLAVAPKALPLMAYGAVNLVKNLKKKYAKHKKRKQRRDKKLQAKVANTKEVNRIIQKSGIMEFINTKTRQAKKVSVKESSSFDMEKDVLLHGVVRIRLKDGRIAEDDIYLFQPRVYSANDVVIGPKISKTGALMNENSYLIKLPGEDAIYHGYTPKREVLSGERFDFVRDGAYADQADPLKEFIDIEIPKDKNGNYIPVDKNDPVQMQAFKKYVEERKKYNIDQQAYLEDLVEAAKDAKATYDYINRPRYAKPVATPDERDIQRIQRSRASRAKREAQARAYYGTINRMNMLDTMMHEYNLDEHADHLPGMGMPGMGMPPGGPLGPGMPPLSSMHHDGPAPGGRHR